MSERRLLDLTQRILYLRSIPIATMLTPAVLKIMAGNMRERTFAPKECLMKQGEPLRAVYSLTEGRVSLIRKGVPFGELVPPQSLGFLGVLARAEGTYDATAEEPTRVLELDADALLELMEDHFELTFAIVRYLSERLLAEIQELPAQVMQERMGGTAPPAPERPLDLVERILYLRGLRAYSETNLNALAQLAVRLVECRFSPGETIWNVDAPSDRVLLVRAGTAICTADGGKKRWRVEPNSGVGGMEVLAHKPRWYSAEAETPLVGFWVAMDSMVDLLEDDFTMAGNFISMLANEVINVLERKASLGSLQRDATSLGAAPASA